MANYATPGVYVEEVPTLPSSVAPVSTAIPVFIGSVQFASSASTPLTEHARVSTLLEFEQKFGQAVPTRFTVDVANNITPNNIVPECLLWYALKHFFDNGGGPCHVVAVHQHDPSATGTPISEVDISRGIDFLEALDEPTLVVIPDAVHLSTTDRKTVYTNALQHCKDDGFRFAILDVAPTASTELSDADSAREEFGVSNLSYGAAYYPFLNTTLLHRYSDDSVAVHLPPQDGEEHPDSPIKLGALVDSASVHYNNARYNLVKRELRNQRVQLPPSAAIAGLYARVDRERGVWKAPANVDLRSTIGPAKVVTETQQETLNIHPGGKSINAIRAFTGRGTLVWGARTLDGNNPEWRYVNVRRLFIMIEESAKKASEFSIFEPNDASTWLKVRGMIDSFLYSLWEQGALQGSTPEEAYYVNAGHPVTMSKQDILDGKMIVEIGVAAVRPAEFIILRFSHFTGQS